MAISSTVRLVPWSDDLWEFFSLAAANWTPPSVVRSVANFPRNRLTVTACFEQPDGARVTLSTRCKRTGEQWFVVGETLRLRLTIGGRAVAP